MAYSPYICILLRQHLCVTFYINRTTIYGVITFHIVGDTKSRDGHPLGVYLVIYKLFDVASDTCPPYITPVSNLKDFLYY